MGKRLPLVLLLLSLCVFSSCLSLVAMWPPVEYPHNPGSSMLVVEVANKSGQYTSALTNNGYTGWIPWVVDSQGNTVRFRLYDSGMKLDSLYYAENLKSGIYTLKGFIHIYSDMSKTPTLGIFDFNPYGNMPYQNRQEFTLTTPLSIELKKAEIVSFGAYYIKAVWKGGFSSPANDRWMINPETFSVETIPDDRQALEVLRTWSSPDWLSWLRNCSISDRVAQKVSTKEIELIPASVEVAVEKSSTETELDVRDLQTSSLLVIEDFDAGGWHSMAIRSNGSLWAAGNNEKGQLGIRDTSKHFQPIEVLDHVRSVALGQSFTLVLKEGGSLWVTGNNAHGELGDTTLIDQYAFKQTLGNVKAISAGNCHSAAITADGRLWTTGDNRIGQLGDGTLQNRNTFASVADYVAFVDAGGWHTCYITEKGELYACGLNGSGQLGDGTDTYRAQPVKIMDRIVSVACGENHTMICRGDGTLWATGNNEYGQLGDGTTVNRLSPVEIDNEVVSVTAGANFTLYIKSDGSLWGMGYNGNGALGDGTGVMHTAPVRIMEHVVAVKAGFEHSLVRDEEGQLWSFGLNSSGQLGIGSDVYYRDKPTKAFIWESGI
ncbi:MAG: hypothetical protein PHN93_09925 [Sphaerochaetaceae bacterium]|nr:hypothetical protein [Sphaerochaetaceae bacterium]